MDGANVGMVQRRRSARFALKTVERLTIFGEFFGQKLEGDETAELGVLGPVDHAHAAAAESFDDAVVRDGLADHWRESYVRQTGQVNESAPSPCVFEAS
jgi:hypothetical protein